MLRLFCAALLALVAPAAASAATIIFTVTGTGQGDLAGTAYSGPFRITGSVDTTDLNPSPSITAYVSNDVVITAGGWTLASTGPLVAFINNQNPTFGLFTPIIPPPPFPAPSFVQLVYVNAPAFASYDFASNLGPVAGTQVVFPSVFPHYLDTNQGRLTIRDPLTNLTFEAHLAGNVPEPATWAMMMLGFGVVGTALRRRQRVSVRYASLGGAFSPPPSRDEEAVHPARRC